MGLSDAAGCCYALAHDSYGQGKMGVTAYYFARWNLSLSNG